MCLERSFAYLEKPFVYLEKPFRNVEKFFLISWLVLLPAGE